MRSHTIIRQETPAHIAAIDEVTIAAFQTLAISNHMEQFMISALRAAGALTISLVAEVDEKVVGHVAFSPVTISVVARSGLASARCLYPPSTSDKASVGHSFEKDYRN